MTLGIKRIRKILIDDVEHGMKVIEDQDHKTKEPIYILQVGDRKFRMADKDAAQVAWMDITLILKRAID
jgi:hypothetical protein